MRETDSQRGSWACPGPATEKRHFDVRGEYRDWNYLRGEGPSAPKPDPCCSEDQQQKAFKPGWKKRRPHCAIQPEKDRMAYTSQKEEFSARITAARKEALLHRGRYNNFNPITGQDFDQKLGNWAQSTNSWGHQGLTIKPVRPQQPSKEELEQSFLRARQIRDMRKARMENDGLVTSKRTGGSMKELMDWGM